MLQTSSRKSFTTMWGAIEYFAQAKPDAPAIAVLQKDGSTARRLSFGALHRDARSIAAALAAAGAGGKAVLLAAESSVDFVIALCGCLHAGAIAVPVPPPARRRAVDRLRAIVTDAAPALALRTGPASDLLAEAWPHLVWIGREDGDARLPAVDPRGPAILQYSSGSTGKPKGIVLTNANLVANLRMLQSTFIVDEGARVLCWLPPFHDMGLVGHLLLALWSGACCTLMSPLDFLQAPRRWLDAIGRHGITHSGGPNFAYDLCVRRAGAAAADLRLSTWRVATCGGERVRGETMRRFAETFALAGFAAGALSPCYGLAEATLIVSSARAGGGVRLLPDGAVAHRTGGDVSCGPPLPGSSVAIVDPMTRRMLGEGSEGEIWIAGDHVAAGYWGGASAGTFGQSVEGVAGVFMRSGDVGFLWDGDLFVTGRTKDTIIQRGVNLHPEDIEAIVAASHTGFSSTGAAFAIESDDGEQVVAVFEVARPWDGSQASQMIAKAVLAVADDFACRLFDLLLVRASTLPRTTSGKVQRHACRELYRTGALKDLVPTPSSVLFGRARRPESDASPEPVV